jgi:hypothetical protein
MSAEENPSAGDPNPPPRDAAEADSLEPVQLLGQAIPDGVDRRTFLMPSSAPPPP